MKQWFKRWLTWGPYKKLWSIIGGRPWTFITRDTWHHFEIVAIFFLLFAGFWTGRYWDEILRWACEHPIQALGAGAVASFLWFTAGHIFWGKMYIPWQKGK